ncbi:MAG: MFS transporter [Acidobacteria bacterium]|nr:MAG: MFS transporter [Acidobacteriota bacterium]
MLDGMDVTLYAMVIPALLREFHLSTSQAGALASVTLIASAAGGILFGFLADRAGRRSALMLSVAVYSVFTAACGLSRGVTELAAFRFLLGLGMGGEWATGAALVAETWRAEHRAKALGLMQSGFAVGYAVAALIAELVMPRWGWRVVFFVGVCPALLTLWIRRHVDESPLWVERRLQPYPSDPPHDSPAAARARDAASSRPTYYLKMVLVTLAMNSAALFAWWGLFTWIPAYLALPQAKSGRGLSIAASSRWIWTMQLGMWLGYVTFGFLNLLVAAALAPLYARAGSARALLALGPLLAFFGTGHFTGFGIITAELFPTSFRASAMGLTYNFGRALSAGAPFAIGAIAARRGLSSAFWISALSFLVAALLALALPETRNRSLKEQ